MRILSGWFLAIGFCSAMAAQAASNAVWRVQLADEAKTPLSVSSRSGTIEFRQNDKVKFTIRPDSITAILHMSQPIRRSTSAYNAFEKMCCDATGNQLLPLLAMAIAEPLGHSKEHFVEVHWYANGEGAALMKLAKSDYIPFLDWLQQISGTNWVDVDQARNQALRDIEQRVGEAFPVRLTHQPGLYGYPWTDHFLVLPVDSHGQAQLYFFRNAVKAKNVAGIMPVTRDWSDNSCVSDSEVLYDNCSKDACDIRAILLPTLTYRAMLPPKAIETDAAGQSESDCAKVKRQQKEWLESEARGRSTLRANPK